MSFPIYRLKNQEPMKLIQRCLILDQILMADPHLLKKVHENFVIEYDEYDDEGGSIEAIEIDWKWCLFGSTMYQLMLAIKAIEKNRKPEEKKSTIITDLSGTLSGDKPKIII